MVNNTRRATRMRGALRRIYHEPETRENVIDALTDLMHLCAADSKPPLAISFNECLRIARSHFRTESRHAD